jgi:hypothetical protein
VPYPILLLVAAIGGAGALAYFHEEPAPSTSAPSLATSAADGPRAPSPAGEVAAEELPPNHPPLGAGGAAHGSAGALPPAEDEPAAISWKVPSGWQTLANPTSIRLATYTIAGGGSDASADVSVSRAGGGTEANVDRWIRQFDDAGQEKRSVKTVRGLKIVVIEVGGTYLGSGMALPSAAAAPSNDKKNWALLGAVVETSGSSYFFKMTGPAATVKSARKSFDALLDSVTPMTP